MERTVGHRNLEIGETPHVFCIKLHKVMSHVTKVYSSNHPVHIQTRHFPSWDWCALQPHVFWHRSHHVAECSLRVHLSNFNPKLTLPIGSNLGSSWHKKTQLKLRPARAAGPILRLNAARWKLALLPLFPKKIALQVARAKPCSPHQAGLRPNFGPRGPPQDQVASSPTCVQTCPKLHHVGPNKAQVGPFRSKLVLHRNLGPNWPILVRLRPKFVWLGQVGPLLSSLFYFLGAGRARRQKKSYSQHLATQSSLEIWCVVFASHMEFAT